MTFALLYLKLDKIFFYGVYCFYSGGNRIQQPAKLTNPYTSISHKRSDQLLGGAFVVVGLLTLTYYVTWVALLVRVFSLYLVHT